MFIALSWFHQEHRELQRRVPWTIRGTDYIYMVLYEAGLWQFPRSLNLCRCPNGKLPATSLAWSLQNSLWPLHSFYSFTFLDKKRLLVHMPFAICLLLLSAKLWICHSCKIPDQKLPRRAGTTQWLPGHGSKELYKDLMIAKSHETIPWSLWPQASHSGLSCVFCNISLKILRMFPQIL